MDAERPHTPFAIKAIKWILIASLFAPLAAMFLGFFAIMVIMEVNNHSWLREINAAYEKTAVGDRWSEVESAFGRPAHFTCRFGKYQIHYYIDPTRYSLHPDAGYSLREWAETKDEIPFSYGAKQYLVKDGVVIAHVWIGEESHVQTDSAPNRFTFSTS